MYTGITEKLGLHSSLGAASFSLSQAVSSRPKEYRLANGLEPLDYLWGRALSLLALQRRGKTSLYSAKDRVPLCISLYEEEVDTPYPTLTPQSHISDPCFSGAWDFCSPWSFLCIPYITPHVDPHHLPALSNTHVDPTLKDSTVYQMRQAANDQLCARAVDNRERNHAQCDLPKSTRRPWKGHN